MRPVVERTSTWLLALLLQTGCTSCGGPPRGTEAPRCPEGMVYIEGGTFTMGTDEVIEHDDLASPAHQVTLSPYCFDRTEVTVAAYAVCEQAGTCSRVHRGINCNNPEYPVRVNHPRNCVTWPQAHTYCEAQGLRLPTEAEWERAARGNEGRLYPWGNEPPSPQHARWEPSDPGRAYRIDGDWAMTDPVGSHPLGSTPEGVHDLAGNVREWVADWYADYSPEPQVNPHGPSDAENAARVAPDDWSRTTRGPSWTAYQPHQLRATLRSGLSLPFKLPTLGFRCAADPRSP
jgi:formylglycine-generating enzyme required for sulfatase activity